MDRLQRSAPPFAPTTTGDHEIADALGPMLTARGLPLVELDAIGGCLTQLNVTILTCLQEITAQAVLDVPAMLVVALEAAPGARYARHARSIPGCPAIRSRRRPSIQGAPVRAGEFGSAQAGVNVKLTPQACSERMTRAESCSYAMLDRWPRPRHSPCVVRRARRGLLQRCGAV